MLVCVVLKTWNQVSRGSSDCVGSDSADCVGQASADYVGPPNAGPSLGTYIRVGQRDPHAPL